jgi:hypothetical protein
LDGWFDMVILRIRWIVVDAKAAGCPTLLSATRSPQIVTGTSEGDVVSYDSRGREIWRAPIGGCISAWPVAETLPSLGASVLASNEDGTLACLSPKGVLRWSTDMEAPVHPWNSIGIAGKGKDASIVVTDRKGGVTALSEDGEVKWRFHTQEGGAGPAAIGDVDGDGHDEIAFCCGEGRVYCLDDRGRYRWNVEFERGSEYSAPVFCDLGKGPCVVTGSSDDHLRCISPEGRLLWTQRGEGVGGIEVGLSLGDIDGDGADEVVYTHGGRGLQAVDGDGSLIWYVAYGGGDQPFGPTIGDVNGDGIPELLLSQRSGPTFRVLSANGSLLEEHELPGGMLGGPVLADVDGDGKIEVVAMSREKGYLVCYGTDAPARPGSMPWPNSRGGFGTRASRLARPRRRVGRANPGRHAIKPEAREKLSLGFNRVGFTIEGRWKRGWAVEIGVKSAGEPVQRGVIHHQSGAFPFEILSGGTQQLTARLVGPGGRELGRDQRRHQIRPFAGESAEMAALLLELQGMSSRAPGVEEVQRRRRMEWSMLEEDLADYDGLPRSGRRKLIARVERALGVMRREVACQRIRGRTASELGGTFFLAWKIAHPWMPFDPETDHPEKGIAGRIGILTEGRANDAFVVQIANLLPAPISVRAWVDPLAGKTGGSMPAEDHLILRQVTWVPTASGRMGADALPELGNSGLLRIDGSSSSRLWVDVSSGAMPEDAYTSTLHLRALVPEEALWDIPLEWRVVDPALPAEMPLKFCNWGYIHSSPLRGIQEASLRDMQDHHTSVFVLTGEWTPRATYDRQGRLADVDWQRMNWILERLRSKDMVLIIGGTPTPLKGAPGEESPEWHKALRTFMPMLVDHLASKGLGYDRWAFYPVDEPGLFGGRLIDILESRARAYKAADPKVQVYTDPVRGMRLGDIERVLDLVDIFQPNWGGIVKEPGRERIDYLRSTGKTLWTYECAGEVKDMVGIQYYWEPIWTTWELGMTGIGFWSYCTRAYDLWRGPNPNGNDWEMVYQGMESPVPSVRWQAVRIAIEDNARLWRMRELCTGAADSGLKGEAGRGLKLVDRIVGEARRSRWDPSTIAELRKQLILKTSALHGSLAR